jgi:hypothetical protein
MTSIDKTAGISDASCRLMIKSLHVENFRCFKEVDLTDLGLINVLVGGNGSGKTALLESIFLPGGAPNLALSLDAGRGLIYQPTVLARTRAGYESIWKRLFFHFSQNQPIVISLKDSAVNTRTLKISYNSPKEIQLFTDERSTGGINPNVDSSLVIPITFETTDAQGKKYAVQPVSNPFGQFVMEGTLPPNALIHFIRPEASNFSEIAQLFSNLRISKQEEPVQETLRAVFPEIANISPEAPFGSLLLYCDAPHMPEKVPVGLVSFGLHKVLAILVGISSVAGGAVLVDEIENGIYCKTLPKLWESIFQSCERCETQLFASTHSMECLQAVLPTLAKHKELFRLLRVERHEDGSHGVRVFGGKEFQSALETGIEFR